VVYRDLSSINSRASMYISWAARPPTAMKKAVSTTFAVGLVAALVVGLVGGLVLGGAVAGPASTATITLERTITQTVGGAGATANCNSGADYN
jgi:hypothetical protein